VISLGGRPELIGFFVWLTDVAAVALLYGLIQAGLDGAQRTKFLGSTLRAAQRRADKPHPWIDRFGTLGLYLFLIVPFAFNSPAVGMVVARVAGIKPGRTIWAILAAITTTALGWTLICIYFGAIVPPSYAWVPLALSVTVTAVAVSLGLVAGARERKREAAEKAGQ
jgi:uncharacterized membrane protein